MGNKENNERLREREREREGEREREKGMKKDIYTDRDIEISTWSNRRREK